MTTQVEKYIKKAVNEAKKELGRASLNNVNVTMNLEADGATIVLAEALKAQSEANEANSDAIMKLAESLKPIDVSAIKIVGDRIERPKTNGDDNER